MRCRDGCSGVRAAIFGMPAGTTRPRLPGRPVGERSLYEHVVAVPSGDGHVVDEGFTALGQVITDHQTCDGVLGGRAVHLYLANVLSCLTYVRANVTFLWHGSKRRCQAAVSAVSERPREQGVEGYRSRRKPLEPIQLLVFGQGRHPDALGPGRSCARLQMAFRFRCAHEEAGVQT